MNWFYTEIEEAIGMLQEIREVLKDADAVERVKGMLKSGRICIAEVSE